VYKDNLEAICVMLLMVMELWAACDQIAISIGSLLGGYKPEISSTVLRNLLLPFGDQMRRLRKVENYVDRRENARFSCNFLLNSPDRITSFSQILSPVCPP
jgi:hypothetical protein